MSVLNACIPDTFIFPGGTTFTENKNRISEIVGTENARSPAKSLKSPTRQTDNTHNSECYYKRMNKYQP